jgi:hypothetical protein
MRTGDAACERCDLPMRMQVFEIKDCTPRCEILLREASRALITEDDVMWESARSSPCADWLAQLEILENG